MRSILRGASAGMTALTVLMLALLVVLAALQYRWTGQLGIAEAEQMRINVQAALAQYADDFDRELTRALVYFLPNESHGDDYDVALLERYDAWTANAPHPGLVSAVYVVRRAGEDVQLSRLNPEVRRFEAVAWDDAYEPLKQALLEPEPRRRERGPVRGAAPVLSEVPALALALVDRPLFGPGRRTPGQRGRPQPAQAFAILKLDPGYITGELLPLLSARHFGDGDYQLVVKRRQDDSAGASSPIYSSGDLSAKGTEGSSDATASLFGLLPGREFPALLLEAGHSAREFEALGRRLAASRRRPPPGPAGAPGGGTDKPWLLTATHRTGSLEAAIATVRLRNLTISFGILALLAGSVMLILQSARRAQELARQKMEFVAGVSHELRTPLAVICSAGQNLADGVTGEPQRVRDYGKLICDEGRRLSDMVAQVLEHAAVQSGRQTYGRARVSLPEVVDAALLDCKILIEDGGFTVDKVYADALPEVEGDAEALRRAVQNLIVNAVKYAGDTAWIGVRVEAAPPEAGRELKITVEDRGKGIEASERARIFEPFFRGADAVAEQIHGNGLGLSLVRQIVEAHGGRAGVISPAPGTERGSAFTLHLPSAPPARSTATSAAADRPGDEIDGDVGQPVRG